MPRDTSQFNKNKKLDRIRHIKIFWVALPLLLLAGIGFLMLMRQPWFFIESLTIEGTRSLDKDTVFNKSRDYLNSSWAGLMPRKNILFFSKSNLKDWITTEFPTIEHVDVSFPEKKQVALRIHEKKPFAVWCQDKDCFFIDDLGMIYGKSPIFSDGVFKIISGEPLENPIGKFFTDDAGQREVRNLIKVLEQVPMHILALELGNEIHVRVDKIGETPVNAQTTLMIAHEYDPGVLREVLTLLLADPVFAKALKEKGSALEYLDLRTPGKMYYKFLE